MARPGPEFGGAPSRFAYLLRSAGGVLFAAFLVFPILLGGIRPSVPVPLLGYVERLKSLTGFVYVSKFDLNLRTAILLLASGVLVADVIYELLILPRMKRSGK